MRPFESDDVDAVFAVFSDPAVGGWVGGAHTSRDMSREMVDRNRAHQAEHGFSMWVVEEREGGGFVGEAGLQLLQMSGPEVEIGWALTPAVWGRGYATEAARAWLDVAFGELGLAEVLATVLPENEPSHRVARRLGMREAGRRHVHRAEHVIWRAVSPAGA
jgi:RimJ/RimL family protein N-acetyltransferase